MSDDNRASPTSPFSYARRGSRRSGERSTEATSSLTSPRLVYSHEEWERRESSGCFSDECEHDTFSPRARSPHSRHSDDADGEGANANANGDANENRSWSLPRVLSDRLWGGLSKRSTTQWLAEEYDVKHRRMIYFEYYIPFLNWIRQYKWKYISGDLIGAVTMASFYIPMALSLANNLGHVPPVNGLYTYAFNPLIYALLGTSPQMILGPEAAGSLLTGNVVRDSIRRGHSSDDEGYLHAEVASVVTGVAGGILLLAGLTRLGFLDNVLSRPFLRGFISAIGVVIIIDQLVPEMGLAQLARETPGVEHGSSMDKLMFVLNNVKKAHGLTCAVSFGSFAVIMVCREVKRRLQPRYPGAAYIPDRFLIVVIITIMTWKLRWDEQGLSILGDVNAGNAPLFTTHFPFDFSHIKHLESALTTSFIIALLGFFESSVAAKSLDRPEDSIGAVVLSPNRELVSLGVANIVGGIFMSLPGFGGYGRSKVNAQTGGRTPMSSIFLSIISVLCIVFVMPAFYYIPKGLLSSMNSVVAWSLIEEAPHDLQFFWRIRGYSELFLVFLVFIATVLYSLPLGIACGCGFSVLRVVQHATRPRIQILGRVRGTEDQFENAEADPGRMEFIEGCLIVKIPEPLTFANTGDLRSRLKRLEDYGSMAAHPALPRLRHEDNNKNIIFDIHGVTKLDGAGAQVLSEILQDYKAKGVRVFFCRIPSHHSDVWRLFHSAGIIDTVGGINHFVPSVKEALRLTEVDSLEEYYRDHPEDTI